MASERTKKAMKKVLEKDNFSITTPMEKAENKFYGSQTGKEVGHLRDEMSFFGEWPGGPGASRQAKAAPDRKSLRQLNIRKGSK